MAQYKKSLKFLFLVCSGQITLGLPVISVFWLLVGSDVVHSLFGDDADVDVVSWAEVTHDARMDRSSHQLFSFLQLREERKNR